MVRDVVAKMAETRTKGVIVNISSIARHGNRGQSELLGGEERDRGEHEDVGRGVRPFGIRVGAVAPRDGRDADDRRDEPEGPGCAGGRDPCGRIGVPEDIWLAVRFVIECEYFNARTLDVDGGSASSPRTTWRRWPHFLQKFPHLDGTGDKLCPQLGRAGPSLLTRRY